MKLRTLQFEKSELPEFLHDCFDFYGNKLQIKKVAKKGICKFQIPNKKQQKEEPLIYDYTMYKEVEGCIIDCYDFLLRNLIIANSNHKVLQNEIFMQQMKYYIMLAATHIARKDDELGNLVSMTYLDAIFTAYDEGPANA